MATALARASAVSLVTSRTDKVVSAATPILPLPACCLLECHRKENERPGKETCQRDADTECPGDRYQGQGSHQENGDKHPQPDPVTGYPGNRNKVEGAISKEPGYWFFMGRRWCWHCWRFTMHMRFKRSDKPICVRCELLSNQRPSNGGKRKQQSLRELSTIPKLCTRGQLSKYGKRRLAPRTGGSKRFA